MEVPPGSAIGDRGIAVPEPHHNPAVRNDGVGGADGSGPGLAGLSDRIGALAGMMQLLSAPGGGTHLFVKLPTGLGPAPRPGSAGIESSSGAGEHPGEAQQVVRDVPSGVALGGLTAVGQPDQNRA
jgi:hypothetical protein